MLPGEIISHVNNIMSRTRTVTNLGPIHNEPDAPATTLDTAVPLLVVKCFVEMHPRDYERQRQENIAKNKVLLEELNIDRPLFEPKQTKRTPATKKQAPKRPVSEASSNTPSEGEEARPKKLQRVATTSTAEPTDPGLRRSGRNVGRAIDYTSESAASAHKGLPEPVTVKARRANNSGSGPQGRSSGKRIHDP